MIPPRGFKNEIYPLRHRLIYACSLGMGLDTLNTVFLPIVMGSLDMAVQLQTIDVNPHNSDYVEDTGPLCRQMSLTDKLNISLKFNMTEQCLPAHHSAGTSTNETFTGDNVMALHALWRPIFGSFTDKLDAIDEDTLQSVATILGLTHAAAEQDVVPVTTNKLPVTGASDKAQPMSSVNDVQVFGDFNMTTNTTMEDHVWDEDLFHAALRRFTNKGALRSMVGRTRHFTLTPNRPFKNYYISKFVPRSIRRIMAFSFLGIQIHVPIASDVESTYNNTAIGSSGHLGIKCIANYHEWHADHEQAMAPTA